MCILYKKSFVKKFQLGDNKPKKNSKARVFQWFIELNPKRNQRHALGDVCGFFTYSDLFKNWDTFF